MSDNVKKLNLVIKEAVSDVYLCEDGFLEAAAALSEIHFFDEIEDPRQKGKITYPLSEVLLMVFFAILQFRTSSVLAIAAHIKVNFDEYKKRKLVTCQKAPSHDTIRRILTLVDPDQIQELVMDKLIAFLNTFEKELSVPIVHQYAIDGKECLGTGRKKTEQYETERNISHLNVYDINKELCLASVTIDKKTNEIPVAQEILKGMALKGVYCTFDALHCQRKTADIISRKRGYYVLNVKENQEGLRQEVGARLSNPKNAAKLEILDDGKRTFTFYEVPANYDRDGFTGMKTFIKMESKAADGSKVVIYFISNSRDKKVLQEVISNRWNIEGDFHKDKDIYLDEDHLRLTNRTTARNITLLNNIGVGLAKTVHAFCPNYSLYETKVYVSSRPWDALTRLLAVMNSKEIQSKIRQQLRKKK